MTAPSRKPTTLAAASERSRKIRNGISGALVRSSQSVNTASSAAEAISRRIVRVEPQPTVGAFEIAYTRSASPPVTVTAPAASKRRCPSSARLSGTNGHVSVKTSAPTGTLTKKIHCQPRYFVRIPPKRTPAAAPEPPSAPQMPSALFRSAPSVNVVVTIESAAGEMIAAPTPCTAREAISTPALCASPHVSDVAVKRIKPPTKIRRRPRRSAIRPPRRRKPPNVIAYAVITHCTVSSAIFRSFWIDGIATLTIATSSTVMKNAAPTTASDNQRRRFEASGMRSPSGRDVVGQRALGRGYSGHFRTARAEPILADGEREARDPDGSARSDGRGDSAADPHARSA